MPLSLVDEPVVQLCHVQAGLLQQAPLDRLLHRSKARAKCMGKDGDAGLPVVLQ